MNIRYDDEEEESNITNNWVTSPVFYKSLLMLEELWLPR